MKGEKDGMKAEGAGMKGRDRQREEHSPVHLEANKLPAVIWISVLEKL